MYGLVHMDCYVPMSSWIVEIVEIISTISTIHDDIETLSVLLAFSVSKQLFSDVLLFSKSQ